MSLWSLFQAASQVGGEILGDGAVMPSSLSLDTRTIAARGLLRGPAGRAGWP